MLQQARIEGRYAHHAGRTRHHPQHLVDVEAIGGARDADRLRRFVSFVNAPGTPDPSVQFVPEREQVKLNAAHDRIAQRREVLERIDGFDVASSGSSGGSTARSVDLTLVSVVNVSRVEVSYTPTPDSRGSALAGSVNFVPRSSFERVRPVFNSSSISVKSS